MNDRASKLLYIITTLRTRDFSLDLTILGLSLVEQNKLREEHRQYIKDIENSLECDWSHWIDFYDIDVVEAEKDVHKYLREILYTAPNGVLTYIEPKKKRKTIKELQYE